MKSAVSFVRKELGFKGKTFHNGRGVYEMETNDPNLTIDEIGRRVEYCVNKWKSKGWIEKVEEDSDKFLVVTFRKDLFDPSYRTFLFGKMYGNLGIMYTWSH